MSAFPWEMIVESEKPAAGNGARAAPAAPSPPPRHEGPSVYRMGFGKHRGEAIENVPETYLNWALENMDWLRPGHPKFNRTLWEIMRTRLGLSLELPAVAGVPVFTSQVDERLTRVLKIWYSAMSRRFHPDHGGSVDRQVVVNVCYRELRALLEQTESDK